MTSNHLLSNTIYVAHVKNAYTKLLEVEKSERGVRGGQGKAKIAQKKGHLTPKLPKIVDEGV